MKMPDQIRIPATYMRGGTSKGVFFSLDDLPKRSQVPGRARDAMLLRVIGSPDPYGRHIDGMGGATSSTSKTVILSRSDRPDHDVDYLFGQVSIDQAHIDWSGNCGNLVAAVGAFAVSKGFLNARKVPVNGYATVRIWQANIRQTLVVRVPINNGEVQEMGDFELDGVTFPAAQVQVDFMNPVVQGESMFPTGNRVDDLQVPSVGKLKATMINAGIPTIFLLAEQVGYAGIELPEEINADEKALPKFEAIRACGAVAMGLIKNIDEARAHQHTPKVAFVAPAKGYRASSGKKIKANDIDLVVRALSMGKLHHAMMGTAAVAIAVAAAVPGTLVNLAAGGESRNSIIFGHPSGTLQVGSTVAENAGSWTASKVTMNRSARILMEGWVRIPSDSF
ncbi:MAG: 2-methylaconitate cis-trans isomerase PrpF [Cellvibrionales bacterium]|nr:2-methylaconitate cis-trans isomerase PrpF [Cellvibrionales bacterium]